MSVDQKAVAQAVKMLLEAVGEDPNRDGLVETPERMGRAWAELLSGYDSDPAKVLDKVFQIEHKEIVLVRDIPFYSLCEHHLLPFYGYAHVAYLPGNGRVTGLSKLARLVEGYARRLQVQERLTNQVAQALVDNLHAEGAAVVISGEHMCMSMRGIQKPGTVTTTRALRGKLADDPQLRAEVLALINGFGN